MLWRHSLLIATCVALFGISTYAAFMYRLRNAKPVLQIVDPSVLELGQVNIQDPCTRTIRLVNTGLHRITIGDMKASCGCVKVTAARPTLEPGEATDVALDFDFLSLANRNDIPKSAKFSVNLYALTKPPHHEVFSWQLTGTVVSAFRHAPQFVEFRSRGSLAQPVEGRFTVEFHRHIDDLDIKVEEPGVDLHIDRDAEHRIFQIQVKAVLGEFTKQELALKIAPVIDGVSQSPIESLVYLEKLADVRAEPAFINLGMIDPNHPSRANVRLVSSLAAEFEVLGARVQSNEWPEIANGSLALEPAGAEPVFVVMPSAAEAGTHTGSVVFELQQHGDKYEVAVPYSFHIAESKVELAVE